MKSIHKPTRAPRSAKGKEYYFPMPLTRHFCRRFVKEDFLCATKELVTIELEPPATIEANRSLIGSIGFEGRLGKSNNGPQRHA